MEIVGSKMKMKVPEEVYAGLPRDKDGCIMFSMDTRPVSDDSGEVKETKEEIINGQD
jgi:hypothetical protein